MIGNVKKVGSDILFAAIKHGNVHDIIALIHDNEVDVNCTNINGQTPLHVSCQLRSVIQARLAQIRPLESSTKVRILPGSLPPS